ncbi:hypothetical protein QF030_007835 [Streptomyces rishiriensis]|uniref:Uncharacterized protein n=1 Tax=Streptomyces rishiriensis TaxID=68264 RepID=A0ABU0P4I8_STRRH|nr:hypothetical protein [Streptomyces rishiriensis]
MDPADIRCDARSPPQHRQDCPADALNASAGRGRVGAPGPTYIRTSVAGSYGAATPMAHVSMMELVTGAVVASAMS